MTTPNSGADPCRSGHDPVPTGERLRPRWNATTCLAAFGLTVPLVYGLSPILAVVTQPIGGFSTTVLVVLWATTWLVLWATTWLVLWVAFQSALEWRTGVADAPS